MVKEITNEERDQINARIETEILGLPEICNGPGTSGTDDGYDYNRCENCAADDQIAEFDRPHKRVPYDYASDYGRALKLAERVCETYRSVRFECSLSRDDDNRWQVSVYDNGREYAYRIHESASIAICEAMICYFDLFPLAPLEADGWILARMHKPETNQIVKLKFNFAGKPNFSIDPLSAGFINSIGEWEGFTPEGTSLIKNYQIIGWKPVTDKLGNLVGQTAKP